MMRAILNIILLSVMTDLMFHGGGHSQSLTIIRSPRARQMRLVVDPRDGTVKLTLPKRAALGSALKWAETKRGWIEEQLEKLPNAVTIAHGTPLALADQMLMIDWHEAYPRNPVQIDDRLRVGGPAEMLRGRVIRWLQREAKTVLESETKQMAAQIGVRVGRVGVGDPVSRWGSCASSGDIRYSWRLILAPSFVRRATVAHEVAHLVHMNHAPAFHALVADIFGEDPSPARRWLRAHGTKLHWFGR